MANFNSIYTARSGIFAAQRALDVTAHNIANATSEGYSRQRAVMKTSFAFQQPSLNIAVSSGMLGTGVIVETIERIRDTYLDRQSTINNGECQYWDIHTSLLERAELAFAEPKEFSLDEALNQFFNVWQDLNQNPTDHGARAAVREIARTLADRFELTNQQLEWAVDEACDRLFKKDSGLVDNANRLIEDIAYYNNEIAKLVNSGGLPNDLMDKRDILVDELSGIAGIMFETNADGTTDILMRIHDVEIGDNEDLVQRTDGVYLYMVKGDVTKTIDYIAGEHDIEDSAGVVRQYNEMVDECVENLTPGDTGKFLTIKDIGKNGEEIEYKLNLNSGAIAGVMEADIKIRGYMDQLDWIAYNFVNEVNYVHGGSTGEEPEDFVGGYTLIKAVDEHGDLIKDNDGNQVYEQGGDFFTSWAQVNEKYGFENGIGPIESESNPDIGRGDINYRGASRLISIDSSIDENLSNIAASGNEINPEDGANALYMAQLEETPFKDLNNSSISNYYNGLVTGMGVDLFGSYEKLNVKEGAQEQIELLRQSVSGVNLDEEMTNMIMFQRAYQASSRVIVTVDRMLEELINLVR